MNIRVITTRNQQYPPLLKEISSPPAKLYVLGKLHSRQPAIAIVGSRKLTPYGKEVTQRLSFDLASMGIVIISGLALGVDTIAHQAALEAGGHTVAVLANGLNQIYPSSNRTLAKRILARGGGIVSEQPVDMPPLKHHFPARNRIIAGLSLGVVITEAAAHSGALITANFALEQNRLVMAVPVNITSKSSQGANNLLKSGATPVTEARDVLTALDFEVPQLKAKIAKPASKEEAVILELLGQDINDSDQLIAMSGFNPAQFNHVITLMELSGKVRNLGTGKWISS